MFACLCSSIFSPLMFASCCVNVHQLTPALSLFTVCISLMCCDGHFLPFFFAFFPPDAPLLFLHIYFSFHSVHFFTLLADTFYLWRAWQQTCCDTELKCSSLMYFFRCYQSINDQSTCIKSLTIEVDRTDCTMCLINR